MNGFYKYGMHIFPLILPRNCFISIAPAEQEAAKQSSTTDKVQKVKLPHSKPPHFKMQ
jgi:hypothetical protein